MFKKTLKVFWFIVVTAVPTAVIYADSILYDMRPLYGMLNSINRFLSVFMFLFIPFVIFTGVKLKMVSSLFALPLGLILSSCLYGFIAKTSTGGAGISFNFNGIFYALYAWLLAIVTLVIAAIFLRKRLNNSIAISEISFPPDEEETSEGSGNDLA